MSIAKFDRPEGWKERLSQRIRMVRYQLGVVQYIAFVALLANTIGRIEHRTYRKKRLRGEKINANEVFSPPFKSEWYAHYQQVVASIAPNEGKNRRKAKQMKQESYPLPEYSYEFSEPPLSGNVINGVGETQPRRVVQPFFSTGYTGPWNKLERLFQGLNKPSLANFILRIFWMDRNRVGLVARQQQPVTEPHKITTEIKEKAREHGAALVGITPLEEDMRFQNFDLPFRFAISIAVPMNRTLMLEAPTHDTMHEIMSTYKAVGQVAIDLARDIRRMGWPARASTNISPDAYEVLHIPVATQAGIGTLGKHGSLISKELGSNIRLATVLTDLPLVPDGVREIGVDDFCSNCQICSTNCPPLAIHDEKQLVRGEAKWYVDFDKCLPYFVEHHSCGICIEVCPWSEPGRGESIMEKMLKRKSKASPELVR